MERYLSKNARDSILFGTVEAYPQFPPTPKEVKNLIYTCDVLEQFIQNISKESKRILNSSGKIPEENRHEEIYMLLSSIVEYKIGE